MVADAYSGDPADRVSFTTGPVGPYVGVPNDTTTTTQPPTPVSSSNDHIAVGSSLPNSTSITLTGSGTGEGALSYLWTQTLGPPVIDPLGVAGSTVTLTTPATGSGSLTFDFEVTDSLNRVATSSATVAYFSSAVPALLCQFFDATKTTGSHTLSLGSTMEMSFTTATATTGTCDDTTRIDVTGATMSLFGWFHLDIATVAVTKTAITISGATLTASDGSLGATQFTLVGTAQIPLSVAGGDLEFEGSVRASALPFVSLPAPWAGTAEIDLTTAGDGSQAIAFHGSVADGGASVAIDGAMATDRTFSLDVVGTDIISVRGSGVDFAGTVERLDPTFQIDFFAFGRLAAPVTLASGVTLDSLRVTWRSTDFFGAGDFSVAVGDTPFQVGGSFTATDPSVWTLTVAAGAGFGSWSPIAGVTVGAPSTSGTVSQASGHTAVDITVSSASVQLRTTVRVEAFSLHVTADCTASACAPVVALAGTVNTTIGSTVLSGAVTGSADLVAHSLSLAATLADFSVGGIDVSQASLAAGWSQGQSLNLDVSGTATALDTTAAVAVAISDQGLVVTFRVANWTPVAGGPTVDTASLIYSSFDTTVVVDTKPVTVVANTLTITGAVTLPGWITSALLPAGTAATAMLVGVVGANPTTYDITATVEFSGLVPVLDAPSVGLNVSIHRLGLHLVKVANTDAVANLVDPGLEVTLPVIGKIVGQTAATTRPGLQAAPATAVTFDGTVDLANLGFSLTVGVTDFAVGGVDITAAAFTATKAKDVDLALSVNGDATVLDAAASARVALSDQGYVGSFTVANWVPVAGGPTVSNASVVYSSFDTTVTVATQPVTVAAKTLTIAASLLLPDWMTSALLPPGTAATAVFTGVVGLNPTTYDITATVEFSGLVPVLDVPSVGVNVSIHRLGLHLVKAANTATVANLVDPGLEVTLPVVGKVVGQSVATGKAGVQGAPATAVTFDGSLDLANEGFTLSIGMTDFVLGGVTITSAGFTATKVKDLNLALAIDGDATVLDTTASASLAISPDGFVGTFRLSDWTPVSGGPTVTNASVIYSSFDTSVFVPGESPIDVRANTLTLDASVLLPSWLTSALVPAGTAATARFKGVIGAGATTYDLTATVQFSGLVRVLEVPSIGLLVGIRRLGLRLVKTANTATVASLVDPGLQVDLPGIGRVVGQTAAPSGAPAGAPAQAPATAVTFDGSLDLANQGFTLSIGAADFAVGGVTITSAGFTATKVKDVDLAMAIHGNATVLDTTASASVAISPDGFVGTFSLSDWTPVTGGPTVKDASVVYATFGTTVTIDNKPVTVDANKLTIAAEVALPDWLTEALLPAGTGATAVFSGSLGQGATSYDLTAIVEFSGLVPVLDAPSVGLNVSIHRLGLRLVRPYASPTTTASLVDPGLDVTLPGVGKVVGQTAAPSSAGVGAPAQAPATVVTFDGSLDLANQGFTLTVGLANFAVGGVTITSAGFTATKVKNVNLALAINGTAFVLDTFASASVALSKDGYVGSFIVDLWQPADFMDGVRDASVVYSSFDTSVLVDAKPVAVKANTLTVAASALLPGWLTDALLPAGTAATALFNGVVGVNPTRYDITATVEFSGLVPVLDAPSVGLNVSIRRLGLHIVRSSAASLTVSLIDPGVEVTLPGVGKVVGQSAAARRSLQAPVQAPATAVTFDGSIDLVHKSFSLSVGVSDFDLGGIHIASASFTATKADRVGLALGLQGTATVLDTTGSVGVALSSDGFVGRFSVANWTPVTNGPTVNSASLIYASFDTTVLVDTKPVTVKAETLTIAASVALPAWLTDVLVPGVTANAVLSGSIGLTSPTTYDLTVAVEFAAWHHPVRRGQRGRDSLHPAPGPAAGEDPDHSRGIVARPRDHVPRFRHRRRITLQHRTDGRPHVAGSGPGDLGHLLQHARPGHQGLQLQPRTQRDDAGRRHDHRRPPQRGQARRRLGVVLDRRHRQRARHLGNRRGGPVRPGLLREVHPGELDTVLRGADAHVGVDHLLVLRHHHAGDGQTVAVKAKVLSLAATASAPAWFLEIIGTTAATGAVSGSVNLANGDMDLSVSLALGGLKLFDTAGVSVSLNTVAIGFKKVGSTLTSTLAASSNLVLPQLSGSATTSIPITVGLTFSNTSPVSLTGSLTVTGDWTDAFGVSGLIIKNLSVAVTLAKAKPSIGLAGVVTLPTDWSSKRAWLRGAPITLVAALGGLSSCFGIEIGQAGGTETVLDVANMGAVTAKHVKLYVSPTGCTVGTASVPAGVQMNFDGAVLGVGLTANLSITPSPFRLQGDIALGDISVSGLTLKGVAATVDVSQLSQAFTFKGDITVLGASAKVTGSAFKTPTTLGIDFTGSFAVNLDGYFQGAMDVSFMYRKTGPSTSLTAKSTANGTLLGQTYSINWGFTFANGVVTKMNGTAAIDVKFGELATITGNGSFEYEAGRIRRSTSPAR